MPKITTSEAARRLGISQPRVRQLIAAKRLPAVKVGRDWLIEDRHLAKVAERKVGRPSKH